MSTTEYFNESLFSVVDASPDTSSPTTQVEILESSYSGEYETYLKITGPDSSEQLLFLTKEHVCKLHEGLAHLVNSFGHR